MSKSQSRIPRGDSKIPTFGSKIARPTKLPSLKMASLAQSLHVPKPISRSASGAELRQCSNLVKSTNFSNSSNNVVDCGFTRLPPDDQQLLVNETIDLVKGSSDSLEAASSGPNETYNAVLGNVTFLKPLDVSPVVMGLMNETVTITNQSVNNETFDVEKDYNKPSRLSSNLAEKGTIALNSTMNCEKLLDITNRVSSPHMGSMTDFKLPNTTKLLCMSLEGDNTADKTLIAEQIQDDLTSNESDENEVEMVPVVLKSQEGRIQLPPKQRFSFGLDLTECTLDCSIELCDVSNSSSMQQNKSPSTNTKQSSFDESLGILTPDQMKEFLDSTKTNTGSHLQLHLHSHKGLGHHQCRIDLTPSPEELPLDPVEVKTDEGDVIYGPQTTEILYQETSQAESDPKTDLLTKSTNSKISNSFIASITSVTSLDTGYQGDGETSRPASRGADVRAGAGSWNAGVVQRRQDPMTDSDFFTESDADDLIHRGDRRAQIIDGQLFGSSNQGVADVPQLPQRMEDSCMDSSGIFTDADTRADDDVKQESNDMSPDTETQSSNKTTCSQRKNTTINAGNSNNINTVTECADRYHHDEKRAAVDVACTVSYSRTTTSSIEENELSSAAVVVGKSSKTIDNVRQSDVSNKTRSTPTVGKSVTVSASKKEDNLTRNKNARRHDMTPRSALAVEKRCKIRKVSEDSQINENERSSSKSAQRKPINPNKWDAVMNKIAENKSSQAVIKKSLSDVKSKVFSGLSLKCSTNHTNTPVHKTSSNTIVVSASSSTISSTLKRQLFSATSKRVNTADSEQSSHSDSSYRSTSPKATTLKISSATWSSKKRDVRLISAQGDGGIKEKLSSVKNGNNTLLKELKGSPPIKKYLSSNKNDDLNSSRSSPVQAKNGRSGCPTTTPTKQHHIGSTTVTQQKTATAQKHTKTVQNGHVQVTTPLTQRNGTIILESASVIKKKVPSPANDRKINSKNGPPSVNHNNNINGAYVSITPKVEKKLVVDPKLLQELNHANKAVEAFGTMIQYLVFNLDAFSCPAAKLSQQSTKKTLLDTTKYLEETRNTCHSLEVEISEREDYYTAKEAELRKSHKEELCRVSSHFEATTLNKDNQIKNLEALLEAKEHDQQQKILDINAAAAEKIAYIEKQLQESLLREANLDHRVQELTTKECQLLEKAHASEMEFSEKIRVLTVQMEKLKAEAASKHSELEEQLMLSRDELSVVRQQQQQVRCTSVSPNKTGDMCRTHLLQDEIESLRCVLDMRQREITDLRKQNQELQISSDDRAAAILKISSLESRVEDLQVQLQQRTEEDQRNSEKLKRMEELYNHELKNKSRLSMHNEELQYRLKQNSERFSIALSELSRSFHDGSVYCGRENMSGSSQNDASMYSCSVGDNLNISPPSSPIVKGVVEKSDSVSYILEMENETPEVLASRFVRRAGSFRSGNSSYEKTSHSPVPKRQRCGLQLSASTTSVQLRRNNSDRSPQNQAQALRVRSKSVTIKTAPKKQYLSKKHSFQDPLCTSSPKPRGRGDSNQLVEEFEDLDDQVFHRDTSPSFKASRGLITCDTSNLTGAELKKLRKPKLAAGEALISGSTSEEDDSDENSSPESPDSPHHDAVDPREMPSLEDALMQKIRATFSRGDQSPGEEISWSEGEPDESVV